MRVYLGADHAGFYLKEKIKKLLEKRGIKYTDLGGEGNKDDDYPDYAFAVAEKVGKSKGKDKGILICGTGVGMCIAANKVKGVRASTGYDKYSVRKAREDNDSNILCLRGRSFFTRKALKLVNIWLSTNFSGTGRHKRRIDKIKEHEVNKK